MPKNQSKPYLRSFLPFALAAFLVGSIGDFGPATPVYDDLADKINRR